MGLNEPKTDEGQLSYMSHDAPGGFKQNVIAEPLKFNSYSPESPNLQFNNKNATNIPPSNPHHLRQTPIPINHTKTYSLHPTAI